MYLSGDVKTDHTNFQWYRDDYATKGIEVTAKFVNTQAEWEAAYLGAQVEADFVIVANNAGLQDWDKERARQHTLEHAEILTVTDKEWMTPYSMLGMTKIPEEQGEWAAKIALEILNGTSPSSIPITPNRRWNIYANPALLEQAEVRLSSSIMRSAIKID